MRSAERTEALKRLKTFIDSPNVSDRDARAAASAQLKIVLYQRPRRHKPDVLARAAGDDPAAF